MNMSSWALVGFLALLTLESNLNLFNALEPDWDEEELLKLNNDDEDDWETDKWPNEAGWLRVHNLTKREIEDRLVTEEAGSGSFEPTTLTKTTATTAPLTSITSTKTSFQTTISLLPTATTSQPVNVCSTNDDCTNVFGGSACPQNFCQCLPPSVFYDQKCNPSFPMKFTLLVYIPINMVCTVAFDNRFPYQNNFAYVIADSIKRSLLLRDIYLTIRVDKVTFRGDLGYISLESVCPPGLYSSAYSLPNRFKRSALESSKAADPVAYQQFLAECNNTASLNYNVNGCWQRFQIDYTLFFNDTERQNTLPLSDRRAYYERLLLSLMLTYRDENVILTKLNDTANLDKVYLDVKAITDACKAYLTALNINTPANMNDCLGGKFDNSIFNETQQSIIEQELRESSSSFPEKCNIYYQTCSYGHRLCVDSDYGLICECQPGYYSPTGSVNTECIKKCSKNCLHGGRCQIVDNQERCYCVGFFFGEFCQIDALVIIIVGAILLFLTWLLTVILWLCYCRRRRKRSKEEKRFLSGQTPGPALPPPVVPPPSSLAPTNAALDDNDRQWDEVLGKNSFANSNVEAINPAFMTNN